MTFSFNVNLSPTTGAVACYEMKQQMKNAGWTVTQSSDATTYNSSGDQISSSSSGSNGLANNSAWFVIRAPDVDGYQRAFCIQRGTTNLNWRIKYSHTGDFSGGSPGATQTPSATDEQIILGGGTDASPTFAALYSTDATYRYHIITGGSTENYAVFAVAVPNGGGAVSSTFFFERMAPNTYAPEDSDPFVILAAAVATNTTIFNNTGSAPLTWYRKGLSGQSFVRTTAAIYLDASSGALIGNGGTNAWNGNDDGLPVLYGRPASLGGNTGLKGIGKFVYWKVANRSSGDTSSISSSKDKIIFSDMIFPWNGSSPVI